ncbi:hypothetical protein PIN17_0137 [Prevotella intermedia 17]|nr:hypothetical protein PIN17_0137 [Prevotella intermedia 17]
MSSWGSIWRKRQRKGSEFISRKSCPLGCRYAVSARQGKQSALASGEKKKRKKCYWIMKN